MTVFTGVIVYLLIWWLVFMTTLSFGYKPHRDRQAGLDKSAPHKTFLKQKFWVTTILSIGLFVLFYLLVSSSLIDFRALAAKLPK